MTQERSCFSDLGKASATLGWGRTQRNHQMKATKITETKLTAYTQGSYQSLPTDSKQAEIHRHHLVAPIPRRNW